MKQPALHPQEEQRLTVVAQKKLQEKKDDPALQQLVGEAAQALGVPMAGITLLDATREVCLTCVGTNTTGPREDSFCGHALLAHDVFICEDALDDDRFRDNPHVINEPYIRFYAGMRLLDRESGLPIGVFCIRDVVPRQLEAKTLGRFMEFAAQAEAMMQ